jgi:hypothetical protein
MAVSRYGTQYQTFGTGGKAPSNYETYELVPQFIERINVQKSKYPLWLISEKMKRHIPIKDRTYYHTESDEQSITARVNGAVNATCTTVTFDVADSKYLRAYDQLYNPLTEEQVSVSSVNTTTGAAVVVRGVGNAGSGSNIADNQEFLIMSQSNVLGGTSQSGIYQTSKQVKNYCMLTREPFELVLETDNTEAYGYSDAWQEQKDAAAVRLARKMEWQVLFGKADGSHANTSVWSTGGLGNFISTNKLDVGGTLTEQTFYNFIRDLSVENGGVDNMIFFAGSYILQYLDAWGRDRLYSRPEDQVAGISIMRYRTSFGEIKLVAHGMLTEAFDQTTTPELPGMLFGVDMSQYKMVYWMPLKYDEGPANRGIQANDSLTKKAEWRATWGCYVGNERAHGWMYGVTELT